MNPFLSLLVVTTLFAAVGVLERTPALRYAPLAARRPYLATDSAWHLVAAAANLVSTFVFRPQLAKLNLSAIPNLEALPVGARLVVAVVVYDFVATLIHIGMHRSDLLWAVHKVHHSSLHLDALATTRTHAFEHLVRNVPAQGALFVLGASGDTVSIALITYAVFALGGHSNMGVGNSRLETILVTPRYHRLHHIPATTQHNFGTILTVWNRAFRRLANANVTPSELMGVPGEVHTYPQRFLQAFRQPAAELTAALR